MTQIDAATLHDLNCRDLVAMAERHTKLQKVGHYWEGPCPFCNGTDRFQIKQRSDGEYRWFCRGCSDGKYLDIITYVERLEKVDFIGAINLLTGGQIRALSQAELLERERQREQEATKRQAELERITAKFTTEEIWKLFVSRMTEENRQWWRDQGLPDAWIDFWKLGYTPDRPFEFRDQLYHSPAYTIPKFDYGWKPKNMDYRLLAFPEGAGKYRPMPDLPPALFISRPDMDGVTDEVLIVEGSKKAMICTLYGIHDDNANIHVFGIPSKTSWAGIVERVSSCGRVWIALDPDAIDCACRMGSAIGKNARIMDLPFKPDDGFLLYGLDRKGWRELQKYARIPKGVQAR